MSMDTITLAKRIQMALHYGETLAQIHDRFVGEGITENTFFLAWVMAKHLL